MRTAVASILDANTRHAPRSSVGAFHHSVERAATLVDASVWALAAPKRVAIAKSAALREQFLFRAFLSEYHVMERV